MTAQPVDSDVINYDIHPAANVFPYMEGEAYREFVEDIRVNGQREPIVLDSGGRLLDGRNRARACQELGIPPKETRYTGDDPTGFVVSHNIHRRHLTESQRAMVAAKLANLSRGGTGANQHKKKAELSIDHSALTTREAARLLNVSAPSAHRARAVLNHGTDEERASVESGEATVSAVAKKVHARRKQEQKTNTAAEVVELPARPEPKPGPKPGPKGRDWSAIAEQAKSYRTIADAHQALAPDGSYEHFRKAMREQGVKFGHPQEVAKEKRQMETRLDNASLSIATSGEALESIEFDLIDPEQAAEALDRLKAARPVINQIIKTLEGIR